MAREKMGRGFDPEEFISPVHVGPQEHGMEGWEPSNPEIGEARDPLGYIPKEKKER